MSAAGSPAGDFSAETQLLEGCARWAIDARWADKIPELASRVTHWQDFGSFASEQGLNAIAADCFYCSSASVPPTIIFALEAELRANARRAMVLSEELARLLRRFSAWDIRVITLKGPALGEAIYRDPAHRFSGDLDLLIHTEDFARTEELLNSEGYGEPGDTHLRSARRAFRKWNYEALYENTITGISVDLHWDLMPRGFPVRFAMPAIWRRAEGTRVCPQDELEFLCAHAAKHERASLSRMVDICLLLKSFPTLDGGALKGPAGIILNRAVMLMNGEESGFTTANPYLGSSYKLRLIFTPTEADWRSLPRLPRTLFFFYFAWRLIRLAVKYLPFFRTTLETDTCYETG